MRNFIRQRERAISLKLGKKLVIYIPLFWLLLFFLVPFLIVTKISLSQITYGRPPYLPMFEWSKDNLLTIKLYFGNFFLLFSDSLYINAYLNSLKIAALSTFFTLLIGYPMAYFIARADEKIRNILLLLVILPFWSSFLLRVYAWIGLLKNNGIINNILLNMGIIDSPIKMLNTDFALYIGIVYSYLPFMILPLYANLVRLDEKLLEAARDLGAKPLALFFTIILPLSMPGIIAGSMLVFIPAIGEYIIPSLLGGSDSLMIGRILWDEFSANRDWPVASALAVAMLTIIILPLILFKNAQKKEVAIDE